MITGITPKKYVKHQDNWQKLLSDAIRDPKELLSILQLNANYPEKLAEAHHKFRLLVPRNYVKKIEKNNWNDPLLRQILPQAEELLYHKGFKYDPVGDLTSTYDSYNNNQLNGILHKYEGRVLLIITGGCVIHCRYCFRKFFPYAQYNLNKTALKKAIDAISKDETITEVILSGGDPLILSDTRLAEICQQVDKISHIKRLRFHTRLPVILPARINDNFLHWFNGLKIQKIIVIHANHSNEFDSEVSFALTQLRQANALLLNQSVLLKGVNNNVKSLTDLSKKLIENQVLPYYLHLLDRVHGTQHFEVDEKDAINLIQGLRRRVSGYMVPKLVREIKGEKSKITII